MKWSSFFIGLAAGMAMYALLPTAAETSCCTRFSNAARDKIAGYAGPFAPVVGGLMDTLGLTKALPSILDALGVPK